MEITVRETPEWGQVLLYLELEKPGLLGRLLDQGEAKLLAHLDRVVTRAAEAELRLAESGFPDPDRAEQVARDILQPEVAPRDRGPELTPAQEEKLLAFREKYWPLD
jgi:hypothetical protein